MNSNMDQGASPLGWGRTIALCLALCAAGCASDRSARPGDLASAAPDTQQCAAWFDALDDAIERAGVADAEAYHPHGFPYLRVNRFLASFRQQVPNDAAAFNAWEASMRALDSRARGFEIRNLPASQLAGLGGARRDDVIARAERCAASLVSADEASAERRAMLIAEAQVPDDYIDWQRVVGLYPLVKLPFFEFAKGWQTEATTMFERAAAETPDEGRILRYRPAEPPAPAAVSKILARLERDRLGIPIIGAHDAQILLSSFAPIYEIDTGGDFDRIGSLYWGADESPKVNTAQPTVYSRIAYTRYAGQSLVQLVYLIWFPERPQSGLVDVLAGELDGLIFRVTLDNSGRPLIYDTIHPCGCYHMFLPTPLAQPIPPPESRVEWAFIPRTLPSLPASQRLVLRLTSRSHYLTDIRPESEQVSKGSLYTIVDDGVLRTLPIAGGTRSVFGSNGIVAGTQRGERALVWPLGIEDAGAMREWGRHATALVGRRHFDDADLLERRFQLQLPPPSAASRQGRN